MNNLHIYHITPSVKAKLRKEIDNSIDHEIFPVIWEKTWGAVVDGINRLDPYAGLHEALKKYDEQ